ncbi:Arylsulfatase A [Bhargavaea ginsengi]|uniref:Arylsulfatase A n=1 Tax=Bhargavaea ginsengi TaxID=426757 RepID=A0A1H6XW96_9BACL|nr:Arylsulfatase A [Bhargavaea ginsengi]
MEQNKPNVVLILADDLGYGDVSSFNPDSKIKTSNIDALAGAGMRFMDSHATSALCTPSRYGLLTGRYNWRSRLKSFVCPGDSEPLIEKSRRTMAQMLKDQGYQTAAVGKWHLGLGWHLKDEYDFDRFGLNADEFAVPETRMGRDGNFDPTIGLIDMEGLDIDYSKPIAHGPLQMGFDYFYGTPASLDQPPFVYIENDRVVEEPTEITGVPGLDRIGASQQKAWQIGVKAPHFIHEEVPANMQNKVLELIEQFAEGDRPFFLYYPVHLVHGPILPLPEFEGKSGIGDYGDWVLQLDAYVGQITDKLKEKGLFGNTIFIFTSDNGASGVADFSSLIKQGHNPSHHFRGHKSDIWEGGHREPTIVSYPPMIKGGTSSNHMVSLSDLYRTLAELTGAEIGDNEAEDSVSNLTIWKGNEQSIRNDIVHSSGNGGFSIRKGHWKLNLVTDGGGMDLIGPDISFMPSELFDLSRDVKELQNVIDQHPDIIESLMNDLKDYVKNGRSTPGGPQQNERNNPTGKWRQLEWMDGYGDYIEEFKK